jgi:hypothetical protein
MQVERHSDGPPLQTEVLDFRSARSPRRSMSTRLVQIAIVGVLAGLLVWQVWPRPVAPITREELQGVYAGMVRGDGLNDASVWERHNAPQKEVAVEPLDCVPLFEQTAFNQFPSEAIDGVLTYWMGQQAISLFTMRFLDSRASARAFTRVEAALKACADTEVVLTESRRSTVRLMRNPVTLTNGVRAQTAYSYRSGESTVFAVHVLQFENTVTWQFRYENVDGEYSPLDAQRLMDSLMLQTRAVLDLRD